MKNLDTIGRFVFAIPFGVFGLMHITIAGDMAGLVPSFIPGGVFWVYVTGIALLAATVSLVIKKHIYLSGLLLAALLIIFVLTIHLPSVIGGNMMSMSSLLKDTSLAGGALLLAHMYREDA
ncbi:MAG: DoxX family protein [Candidatus Marinimicrobia bacterium]|nr:DoxX family protein [Candidatus Neomarinimicrobiota bacterium]